MKLYTLKIIKQLLVVVIGLLILMLIKLFTLPTLYINPDIEPEVIIKTDTVWSYKTDTLQINTKQYETVYLTKTDTVFEEVETVHYPVRLYQDTLETEDVTIYSKQYVDGELVNGVLSYRLHVPEVIKTIRIKEKTTKLQNGLFAYGEVGGNRSAFTNVSLGLLYTHQTKWLVSYRVNMNPIYKPTHHVGVGFRLL